MPDSGTLSSGKPVSSVRMEDVIRRRKTVKVLAEEDLPALDRSEAVKRLLELSGWAPFHRPCDESHRTADGLPGIEPWRFHVLDAATCRRLRDRLPEENAGKIPAMLAAAETLILATWLPNPPAEPDGSLQVTGNLFEPTLANMEHIAAASAAIQNLLLAATSQGVSSYWSSGGVLRTEAVFELLEIPDREVLLGAVFLFPDQTGNAQVVGSKLRGRRGAPEHWARWVALE